MAVLLSEGIKEDKRGGVVETARQSLARTQCSKVGLVSKAEGPMMV